MGIHRLYTVTWQTFTRGNIEIFRAALRSRIIFDSCYSDSLNSITFSFQISTDFESAFFWFYRLMRPCSTNTLKSFPVGEHRSIPILNSPQFDRMKFMLDFYQTLLNTGYIMEPTGVSASQFSSYHNNHKTSWMHPEMKKKSMNHNRISVVAEAFHLVYCVC